MVKFDVGSVYKGFEVFEVPVDTVYQSDIKKYHKVSSVKVFGTEEERKAMMIDIQKNGQAEPIALYRKRSKVNVIDGRNRLSALKLAGIKMVKCFYLPTNYTLKELQEYVMSTRIRVNSSIAQRAIEAFRLSDTASMTQKAAAMSIGVNVKEVEKASAISKIMPQSLDAMFDNGFHVRHDGRKTRSLSSMLVDVKQRTETIPNAEYEDFGDDEYIGDDGDKYAEMAKQTPNIIGRRLKATEDKVDKLTEDLNKVLGVLEGKQETITRLAKKYVPEWTAKGK